MSNIITKLTNNPRQLFLIDGIGAMVSAFSLGVVLVAFNDIIGMPIGILYYLALPAVFFMLYSLTCYFRFPDNWQPYLRAIAITNLTYCFVTVGLMIYYSEELTFLGHAYFIIEVIIVVGLACIELRRANNQ